MNKTRINVRNFGAKHAKHQRTADQGTFASSCDHPRFYFSNDGGSGIPRSRISRIEIRRVIPRERKEKKKRPGRIRRHNGNNGTGSGRGFTKRFSKAAASPCPLRGQRGNKKEERREREKERMTRRFERSREYLP